MTSTYARVMTGSTITAPAIKRHTVYLLLAALVSVTALIARHESSVLFVQPAGVAVIVGVAAGLVAKKSMALTPWGLVSAGVAVYGADRLTALDGPALLIVELMLFVAAVTVGVLQLRVELVGGHAAERPSRARWGSVLVMTTACIVVIASSRPDVAFADWVRGTPAVASRSTIQQGEYGRVTRIGRLDDPTLIESSGLVASRSTPGILWSHNDSGTPADLYCMGLDGASCGRWAVAGAANRDWEDIAAGPGPDPRVDFLYIGDIGDNVHAFSSITVYRIPEPAISGVKVDPITARAEALVLKYPDGPHDAEALLVHPVTGAIYVITKGADTGVYKASASSTGSAPTILEKIAHLSLFANFADVTGGDISPDGSRVALATYGGWYELALSPRSRDFDSIWTTTPTRIGQRVGRQWESIAYSSDGASVFMTSEGLHSAMFGASR